MKLTETAWNVGTFAEKVCLQWRYLRRRLNFLRSPLFHCRYTPDLKSQ
ncbi:MAG: hypothetical protein SXA11_14580 [Cyanobacteriota bacterium]|nr:hypothetical protein [Cyanobacteriota bacterium]